MKYSLESLRVQKPKVKAALCDVSDDPNCHALVKSNANIIAYTRHGPDEGQSDAINEGWCAVDGDIYGWLNVDDYLAPDALNIAEQIFTEHPDIDVVYGQSLILREQSFIGLHSEVRPMSDELYRSNIISQPSCFVRREALFKTGLLDVDLHYTMDWDLWVRLREMGAKFHYVPLVLSVVAWDEATKTASFNKQRYKELLRLSRRHAGWYASQRTALSFLLEHLSQYGLLQPIFKALLGGVRKKNNVPDLRWRPVKGGGGAAPETICEVPLFHYGEDSQHRLVLDFKNETNREIEIGEKIRMRSSLTEAQVDIDLVRGQSKILRIRSEDGAMADLMSVALEKAEAP